MRTIRITAGEISATAELNDSATATAVWNALPLHSKVNTWGDEVYFSIPVSMGDEDPKSVVDIGDIAFWPPGKAFCLFFGPTPASRGNEVRPASPVNVIGRVSGDATVFRRVPSGTSIEVDKA